MIQCQTCRHWEKRGGIVAPRVQQCTALEEERSSERMIAIVTAMARTLAQANRCPAYSTFHLYPDAYRAEDLPETPP